MQRAKMNYNKDEKKKHGTHYYLSIWLKNKCVGESGKPNERHTIILEKKIKLQKRSNQSHIHDPYNLGAHQSSDGIDILFDCIEIFNQCLDIVTCWTVIVCKSIPSITLRSSINYGNFNPFSTLHDSGWCNILRALKSFTLNIVVEKI